LIFKIGELDNDFSDKEDNDILADTNLKNEIKRKLYDMLVKKGILEPSDNSGKQLINFNQIDLTNACDLPYFKESKDLVADYNRRSGNL
jgi:predicted transcriptional regulator